MAQLKYEQIKSYLQAEAVKPESATRMPTVRELMRRFNVSLVTVNRALSELEHAKVIVRRQGGRDRRRPVQPRSRAARSGAGIRPEVPCLRL